MDTIELLSLLEKAWEDGYAQALEDFEVFEDEEDLEDELDEEYFEDED